MSSFCCRILVLAAGLLALAACARPPLTLSDPDVAAARLACQDRPENDRFACIEQRAVAALNPEVCRLLGISVDDACLQSVYEAADDPAICDRLYLPGIVRTCQAYYADPKPARPSSGSYAPQPVSNRRCRRMPLG